MVARRSGQIDLFTRRIRRAPPPKEINLHCQVADLLRDHRNPGWKYNHIASGEYRTPATAARLKRMGVVPGWPDFILFSPAVVPFFLELKRRGEHLTEEQEQFAEWALAGGGAFEMCDSLDGALDVLEKWGVLKTKVTVAA